MSPTDQRKLQAGVVAAIFIAAIVYLNAGSAPRPSQAPSRPAPPADLDATAQMTGALIAQAAKCGEATKPLEDSLVGYLDRRQTAASEKQRMLASMIEMRRALTNYLPPGGCDESRHKISEWLERLA